MRPSPIFRAYKTPRGAFTPPDFLDDGFDAPLRSRLARHDVIAMRVTDQLRSASESAGIVEVVDLETGTTAVVDSASTRSRSLRRAA